ncbi:MAG: aspartate kinase [Spirochaetaceae bacterium]|jgi:aspartate kinase|nr:aspartate kinase [Spirochaetaceae bacterium]
MSSKIHSVEKIGGTSMSNFETVKKNIILKPQNKDDIYNRIFVVSAYGGITDDLLEHKKTGQPGIYGLFANSDNQQSWKSALDELKEKFCTINSTLFKKKDQLTEANDFIVKRLDTAEQCLVELTKLCSHGHFSLGDHLFTVREMLASLGEAHSAWNMARLLQDDQINSIFVDLTGWDDDKTHSLDERITKAFDKIDLSTTMPITTGYAHSDRGLMATFNRGYSEMTFSRIAVMTNAAEAVIHKEFHLSSADPKIVGVDKAVPIGFTNYDVADHLSNLGMEAIHPKAASGLRKRNIPLRIKNTFEPDHQGTLITVNYCSPKPMVEIIAGRKDIYALEIFDQEMIGKVNQYEQKVLSILHDFRVYPVSKSINANTITHFLSGSLKNMDKIRVAINKEIPNAEINQQKVGLVSIIGTDMKKPGILLKALNALFVEDINILGVQQSMREVEIQLILKEEMVDKAIKALHVSLIEVYDHGDSING